MEGKPLASTGKRNPLPTQLVHHSRTHPPTHPRSLTHSHGPRGSPHASARAHSHTRKRAPPPPYTHTRQPGSPHSARPARAPIHGKPRLPPFHAYAQPVSHPPALFSARACTATRTQGALFLPPSTKARARPTDVLFHAFSRFQKNPQNPKGGQRVRRMAAKKNRPCSSRHAQSI